MMEIGEKIMFLYKGKKLWQGDSGTLTHSSVDELNEFINANKLIREMEK
jgi:phospholipid/cholesterol/gamma-HCH transport system ATP-binding protein